MIAQITSEKRELEEQAAEQAEQYRQLAEANNSLSARALALAEEAASAGSDGTAAKERIQVLQQQLEDNMAALEDAKTEMDAIRDSGQAQNIALLDELNSMQNENERLRNQLRAAGKL